jgi:hypothetical protein
MTTVKKYYPEGKQDRGRSGWLSSSPTSSSAGRTSRRTSCLPPLSHLPASSKSTDAGTVAAAVAAAAVAAAAVVAAAAGLVVDAGLQPDVAAVVVDAAVGVEQ